MSKEISNQKPLTKGDQMFFDLGYKFDETTDVEFKAFIKEVSDVFKIKEYRITFRPGRFVDKALVIDHNYTCDVDFTFDEIIASAEVAKEIMKWLET